ncbi:MAG: hypothetical protein AAF640_12280 [Pseudomonadota bacterium]
MSNTRAGLDAIATVPRVFAENWRKPIVRVRWLIASCASATLIALTSAALHVPPVRRVG